jgi:uncharacterized protein (TIGR02099 family)
LLLAAALATLKYGVMPRITNYQGDILARISSASGMEVSAASLKGGWSGFSPFIEMEGVTFREPANIVSPTRTAGSVALSLPMVRAGVSIPYLLIGQPRLTDVSIFAPALSLIRANDGLIYFAGRALNKKTTEPDDPRFLNWLIKQPGIALHNATLTWQDDLTPGATLRFTEVGLQVSKRFGKHTIGFSALPPATLAKKISARGSFTLDTEVNDRFTLDGTLFTDVDSANLVELRRHINVPDAWQAGVGNVRAWLVLDTRASAHANTTANVLATETMINPLKSVTADVSIINARVKLGEDAAPLNIIKLAGRLDYEQLGEGFRLGSKKLEFRTSDGVVSLPADFSFKREQAGVAGKESGEITANGIDLKVVTSLIQYFPIGRDARETVEKFAARGSLKEARFQWTGALNNPTSYLVKGGLSDFAIAANGRIPGISGFSGTIDGTNKGGTFNIASKAFTFDERNTFRDALKFDHLESQGKWAATGRELKIDFSKFVFSNRDLAGEFSGQYTRTLPAPGVTLALADVPGTVDIKGKFSQINVARVGDYLPNGLAKSREYIEWAARDGVVESADFLVKGRIYDFPFHLGKGGQFSAKAALKNVAFRYAEGWPQVNAINGELVFENTAIRAAITSAETVGARLRNVNLSIADTFIKPNMLNISGDSDARGEDVMKFFRESPLIDGVGAFTKSVAIEGAGKLRVDMAIPLWLSAAEKADPKGLKFLIKGNYALIRGTAKPVVGPVITNLNGNIQFSEAGVKSNALAGVAYGNLLTINIAGGGDAGVATDFAGRVDIQQLGNLLPFILPQQLTGLTDVTGRILAKPSGVDITVDAPMLGVTSTLPYPLAKRADEARRLKLAFTNLGTPSEKIRLNLLGNIATGAATDNAESRIDARFQRKFDDSGKSAFVGGMATVGQATAEAAIPEGIWIQGTMKQLDFDQWLNAINNFTPTSTSAASTAADNSGGGITGIDFNLGRLIAYGRPFDQLKIKGRRTAETWAMSVASREVEGDFTWRASAFNERGAVRARLKKLVLVDEPAANVPTPSIAELKQNEGDLPALDIVADEFTFKEKWLGKLTLNATPQVDNWKIDKLSIANGHVKIDMDGLWQRYGDPFAAPSVGAVKSLTTMNVKLDSNNLNALFNQFGFGDHMRGGRGTLEGKLSWPGHTYQFQLASLAGEFKVDAERGQFAKIPAGAGKLLGLISLQSIPRRLSFDFRDLFSEGFAFDKIEGEMNINNGVIFAKKFEIAGPAATVRMTGDISLPTERQNLNLIVAPKLSGVVAVGTAVLVNPLVGLGVLLGGEVLKSPIEKILSVQYSVTGTWDNPVVERTGKVVAPSTAPSVATPIVEAKK